MNMDRILSEIVGGSNGGPQGTNPLNPGSDGKRDPAQPAGAATEWTRPAQQPGSWLGNAGALGVGAAAGGLAGVMFGSKRLRELAGTALQVGAVAAIGGLAYKAYQNYREGRPVVPQNIRDMLAETPGQPGAGRPTGGLAAFIPPPDQSDQVALLLLKAMIAAAAADGRLDLREHEHISAQIAAGHWTPEDRKVLDLAFAHPSTIEELAAAATTPALRAEVYTAARLAIEPDSPAERDWLDRLGGALAIEPKLRAHLDAIGAAQQARAAA